MIVHVNDYFQVQVAKSFNSDYQGLTYHAVNKVTGVTEYESPVMINCIIAAEELRESQERYHSGELLADDDDALDVAVPSQLN